MTDIGQHMLTPRPQIPAAPRIVDPPKVGGRPPPHDLDAEAAVLSAVLLDRAALDAVLEILKPEHFYSEANGRIFQATQALAVAMKPIDIVSVASWLRDREWLQKMGGTAYLAQIADATPAVGHVEEHARNVQELWMLRKIIATAQRISAEGYFDIGDRREWMAQVAALIPRIIDAPGSTTAVTVREALKSVFEEVTRAAEEGTPRGIPTGWRDLDRLAGPLKPQLVLVGALSSVGKTSFARCLALALGFMGFAVLIFSMEMDVGEMSEAMLFTQARMDGSKIDRKERLTNDDWRKLADAAKDLANAPIWIDDRTALRPFDIQARTISVQAEARALGYEELVVIVDYVQLINGRDDLPKNASREQEIGHIGRALKNLSQRLKVPVIALSQLNDEYKKRADKEPELGDLRESRGLTQAANRVLLLHNPAALARSKAYADGDRPVAPTSEVMDVIVAKNRGGRTGRVRMVFFPHCTLFADYDGRGEPMERTG